MCLLQVLGHLRNLFLKMGFDRQRKGFLIA